MPKLSLPDVALHYEVSGTGPPLLMIAGMVSDNASWAPLLPLLEPHFTLIRPDNRTTGRTTPIDAPVSVSIYAQDCAALLDHLDIPQAHVLGHSMGGMIALEMMQDMPAKIASLTLAATAPIRLTRNLHLFKALLAIRQSDAAPDTWLRAFFPWLFAPAVYDIPGAVDDAAAASLAYAHAQTVQGMAHQLQALEGYQPTHLPAEWPVPAQALLAADDMLIPLPLAQSALDGLPVHIVPNAGHSIHWDAADTVATHVKTLAQTHPIRGAL
jgi:pimeloyl-ACP methyl ester carboxylesterase